MNCLICNRKLVGHQRKFCSTKCSRKDRYSREGDAIKRRARKWAKENPEKFKENNKNGLNKFIQNKFLLSEKIKNFMKKPAKW